MTDEAPEAAANRAVVARLMSVVGGEAPIERGVALVASDVVTHIDGWRFRGIDGWASWIRYIRTGRHLTSPTLLVEEIVVERDSTLTVRGRWSGMRRGRRVVSKGCAARYRVVDGRVAEIWCTRHTYADVFGAHVGSRLGFAMELLRVWWWARREARFEVSAGRPASASLGAPSPSRAPRADPLGVP